MGKKAPIQTNAEALTYIQSKEVLKNKGLAVVGWCSQFRYKVTAVILYVVSQVPKYIDIVFTLGGQCLTSNAGGQSIQDWSPPF